MIESFVRVFDGGPHDRSWDALERQALDTTPRALLNGAYRAFDFGDVIAGGGYMWPDSSLKSKIPKNSELCVQVKSIWTKASVIYRKKA